jgi:hypothetical protein
MMHLFYNIILLIFEFIIRLHFKTGRKKQFESENRELPHPTLRSTKIYQPIYPNFYNKAPDTEKNKNKEKEQKKEKTTKKQNTRPPWQASNQSIQRLIKNFKFRKIPDQHPNSINQPIGFNKDGSPTLLVKGSADWIHMIGHVGVYYIYQLDLHPYYKEVFSQLLWWMMKLRRRFVIKSKLNENNINSLPSIGRQILAMLEYMMPVQFCTILVHLLQHVCQVLLFTGPCHGTWMMTYERYVQICKGRLHSPFSPEEGLMKATMTGEWLTFFGYKTKEDLSNILTPPLDHNVNLPIIDYKGNNNIYICIYIYIYFLYIYV